MTDQEKQQHKLEDVKHLDLRMNCLHLAVNASRNLGGEDDIVKTAKEFYDFVTTGVRKKTEDEISDAKSPRGKSDE